MENLSWDNLLSAIFSITIAMLAVITVMFYLEHKLFRNKKAVSIDMSPTHGRFFVRYIPQNLAAKYVHAEFNLQNDVSSKRSLTGIFILLLGLMLLVAIGFIRLKIHWD